MNCVVTECPICRNPLSESPIGTDYNNNFHFRCAYCGEFEINGFRMVSHFNINKPGVKPARDKELCIALRHLYEESKIISKITDHQDIDKIKQSVRFPSGPLELIDILLLYLHKHITRVDQVKAIAETDCPLLFMHDKQELYYLVRFAKNIGYVDSNDSFLAKTYTLRLELKGWERISQIVSGSVKTKQVFVAMKFGDTELDSVYENGIRKAVGSLDLIPYRVDKEEYNDKIDDKIIAEINKSDFLIADTTIPNINVHFEAGYAMGQRKPVIWCCKEGTQISDIFDTRQYKHIIWENAEDLVEKLTNRIKATILDV